MEENVFPLPTIYSLDGVRLRADGLQQESDRFSGKLDYIFGENNATDLQEIRNLERELQIIADMKKLVQQENDLSKKIEKIESELSDIQSEINRIERKYGKRNFRATFELMDEGDPSDAQSRKKQKSRK